MPKILPPETTRFPVNRQDHTQKHPNGYLTPLLKKLLKADWKINDEKIKKLLAVTGLKETIATALVLRRILNGCEGDDMAIERIFDRVDGKVADNSKEPGGVKIIIVRENKNADAPSDSEVISR